MWLFKVTPEERAASKHGRRKWDEWSVPTLASALAGAAAGMAFMFEKVETHNSVVTACLVLIGAVTGAMAFGAVARAVRTGDVPLLGYTVFAGLVFMGSAICFDQNRAGVFAGGETVATLPVAMETSGTTSTSPTTLVELPDTTQPEVASGGPVPAAADTTGGTLPAVDGAVIADEPLTCSVMLRDELVLPGLGCADRVLVAPFGSPISGPSAWLLDDHSLLALEPPDGTPEWTVVERGSDIPALCVTETAEVIAHGVLAPEAWMEQARLIELVDAPSGTEVILWADCQDPVAGTGVDTSSGWIITVM